MTKKEKTFDFLSRLLDVFLANKYVFEWLNSIYSFVY